MARKRKIKRHAEEHKKGNDVEFEALTGDDIKDLSPDTPVVIWVLHQAQPGGIFSRSTDFTLKDRWKNVPNPLKFKPTKVGVYTLVIVANVDNRPVTFKSETVKVT